MGPPPPTEFRSQYSTHITTHHIHTSFTHQNFCDTRPCLDQRPTYHDILSGTCSNNSAQPTYLLRKGLLGTLLTDSTSGSKCHSRTTNPNEICLRGMVTIHSPQQQQPQLPFHSERRHSCYLQNLSLRKNIRYKISSKMIRQQFSTTTQTKNSTAVPVERGHHGRFPLRAETRPTGENEDYKRSPST